MEDFLTSHFCHVYLQVNNLARLINLQDKIASFLEIKKKELELAKVELRVKDRDLEELEEKHQDEIKVYLFDSLLSFKWNAGGWHNG